VVLDVGCGAGLDLVVAAGLVGPAGRVCGIDLTEEMVSRARSIVRQSGYANIEVRQVDSEDIPYRDSTFDIVLSNGVINLSPRKLQLFREIRRVLKPGGSLQFADIVLDRQLPPEMSGTLEAWSQ
jgi:ubiquinone/menaquinone biosynthesis C-methylase UbiE